MTSYHVPMRIDGLVPGMGLQCLIIIIIIISSSSIINTLHIIKWTTPEEETGAVFTTLHFLNFLQIGPIS